MDGVNIQRACINELAQEFREITMRQQHDWFVQWLEHAQRQRGPARTEIPEVGFSILFNVDSFSWEFKVRLPSRDPLNFVLRHDAPWSCWDLNMRGELAVLLASEGTGAAIHDDEFSELSRQVKESLGGYLKHFKLQMPKDGETNFGDYR